MSGSQSYKEMVQLALRDEKLTGKEDPGVAFKKEKDLVSPPSNHQRKVKIQIFLRILLVRGLILSVHHSLFDLHNRQSWGRHLKVLPLEEDQ